MGDMYKNLNKLVVALGVVILISSFSFVAHAQSQSDLRINEYLLVNDSNYIDDFGQHGPWFEIFNSAYNTVDMGGMYLTDDMSNPKKYFIPKGDRLTKIPSRNHLVFFAEDKSTRGILHVNFDLRKSKFIALFDASGKVLIDSVKINSAVPANIACGRESDGDNKWVILAKSTPQSSNQVASSTKASDVFAKVDPLGAGLTVVSLTVVFFALALLTLFFTLTGKIMSGAFSKKRERKPEECGECMEVTGDISAAIAFAINQYAKDLHADENNVITIRKVARAYSPWSSKIYQIRQSPR